MPKSYMDLRNRPAVFSSLEERGFDLLIIGAGITGAGIARDAAMRGLSVALVEANDFAAGTSSRSSKLVHGGMRYIEHLGSFYGVLEIFFHDGIDHQVFFIP